MPELPNVVGLTSVPLFDSRVVPFFPPLPGVANSARAASRLYSSSLWVVLPAMVAAKRVLPWGITSLTSLEFVAASPCALPSLSSLRCASAALTLLPSLPSTQSRPRPTQDPDDAPAPPLVRLVPHASPGRVLCPTALLFLAHLCRGGSSYPCAAPTPSATPSLPPCAPRHHLQAGLCDPPSGLLCSPLRPHWLQPSAISVPYRRTSSAPYSAAE